MTKRAKKTGNKSWVTATTVQDLNVSLDEASPPGDDEMVQKLEVMMKMLTDLSSRVKDQQREVGTSSTVSPSTSYPVRRRHQMSPNKEPDRREEVCRRATK